MAITENLTQAEEKFFTSKGEEAPPAEASKTPDPTPAETKSPPETVDKTKDGAAVPHGAFHEERERRKAAEKTVEEERLKFAKTVEEERLKFAKLQSRLDTLTEIAKTTVQPLPTKPAEPEAVIPDINVDPVGHFRMKTAAYEKEIADLRAWRQSQEQNSTAINNVQRISQIAMSQEAEFKKTSTDYDAASTHLRNLRDAQLVAYGVSDPLERQNIIAQDAITIAAQALTQNKNPAQVIYDMAKASGYTKAATPPENGVTRKTDGGPSEAEKVNMAAKGQQAGASLGQLNGAASPPTTLETLLQMDESEFAEATKGDKWRKLFASR